MKTRFTLLILAAATLLPLSSCKSPKGHYSAMNHGNSRPVIHASPSQY
jgi:hypothetical protein